ncbi:MAG: BlaI/MecI/CopY family transcriptional regulator [Candidatus Sulfotelmatobacter sp.]
MKRGFHLRASLSQLGPLEQRLLEALWERGHATVRDLLNGGGACQDLAYTTVMTTLDRLFKKNLLSRQAEGRAFRYAPRFTREELHREVAGEAVRQLMEASPAASLPLSYLVEVLTERDAQLLDELGQVVEAKRRQLRTGEMRGESRSDSKHQDCKPRDSEPKDSKPEDSKPHGSKPKENA